MGRTADIWRTALVVLALAARPQPARAQAPDEELEGLSLVELLSVEIESLSLRSESVAEAPGVVSVVQARDFETYQFESIADALRLQPDIHVIDDLSSVNAGVRGVNGGWGAQSKVFKVMLDRQDIGFKPTAGSLLGPEAMPLLAIRHVEVIRGPLSSLYGANAFLGVINVVPQTAEELSRTHPGQAVVRGGYVDQWGNPGGRAEGAAWWRNRRWDIMAAAYSRMGKRDGLRLPRSSPRYELIERSPSGVVTKDDDERTDTAYGKVELNLDRAGKLRLDSLVQHAERTGHFDPDSEPLTGARYAFYNVVNRLDHTTALGGDFRLQSSVGYSFGGPTKAQRLYDPFRINADYVERDYAYRQLNGQLALHYDWKDVGSFSLGTDLFWDHEELPGLRLFRDGMQVDESDTSRTYDFKNAAGFAQGTIKIVGNLRALLGGRIEHHSLYGRQLNYRGVLVYSFNESTALKAIVATAFQAPSPILLFGGEHPRLVGIRPNAELKPQRVTTYELAFNADLLKGAHLVCNAYYNQLQDFVELDTVVANPQASNRADGSALGGSLTLNVEPVRLPMSGFANVSYVRTRISADEIDTLEISSRARLSPELTFNVGSSYTFAEAYFRLFAVYRWTGQRAADKSNLVYLPLGEQKEYFLDAFGLLDLGIASVGVRLFGPRETRLSLRVSNALDTRYTEPGFTGVDVPGRRRTTSILLSQEF